MKIRNDFVSNSSSSSFMLYGEYMLNGISLLKRIAETCEIPYAVENDISLHVYALNRNIVELRKMLDENCEKDEKYYMRYGFDDPKSYSPDKLCWDYVNVPLSEFGLKKLNIDALKKADRIDFYMDTENSSVSAIILKMLYLFFQKNGCCPDAFDSEQDFISPGGEEKFMRALAGNIGQNRQKDATQ